MLLGYGFEPRPYTYALTLAGLVMIVSLSMDSLLAHEKTCLMTKNSSDQSRSLGFSNLKGLRTQFRQSLLFSSSLKKTKEGCSQGGIRVAFRKKILISAAPSQQKYRTCDFLKWQFAKKKLLALSQLSSQQDAVLKPLCKKKLGINRIPASLSSPPSSHQNHDHCHFKHQFSTKPAHFLSPTLLLSSMPQPFITGLILSAILAFQQLGGFSFSNFARGSSSPQTHPEGVAFPGIAVLFMPTLQGPAALCTVLLLQ